MKFALVGYGYWGPNIARTLINHKNIQLEKIIDKDQNQINQGKKILKNINFDNNLNNILKNREIEAVVLATPPETHFMLAKKILNSKKHLLVEKPITKNFKQLEILNKLAKRNKKILLAGDTFLYHDTILKIKKLIKSKKFGELISIKFLRLNFGKIRDKVNVIESIATHDLSILLFLLDYKFPNKIRLNKIFYRKNNICDEIVSNLNYKNKIDILLWNSWFYPEKIRKIIFVFSKKTILFDDFRPNYIKVFDNKSIPSDKNKNSPFLKKFTKINKIKFKDIKINYKTPLYNEMNYFYKSIKNKKYKNLRTGYYHSKKLLKLIEKINNV